MDSMGINFPQREQQAVKAAWWAVKAALSCSRGAVVLSFGWYIAGLAAVLPLVEHQHHKNHLGCENPWTLNDAWFTQLHWWLAYQNSNWHAQNVGQQWPCINERNLRETIDVLLRYIYIYRLFNVNKKKWRPKGRFPNQLKMANYARSIARAERMGVDGIKILYWPGIIISSQTGDSWTDSWRISGFLQ